jgi:hypothetical protein
MNRGRGKNSLKQQWERIRMRIKDYSINWVRPSSETSIDDRPPCGLLENGKCLLQTGQTKDLPGRFAGAEPYFKGDCRASEE